MKFSLNISDSGILWKTEFKLHSLCYTKAVAELPLSSASFQTSPPYTQGMDKLTQKHELHLLC